MAMWGSTATAPAPWGLQPRELETWYNDNIQLGTSNFDDECRQAVDRVVRHIHRVCSTRPELFDVSKVVKGGSFGKGTMVQDLSDVDLVVFINPPHLQPIYCYASPQVYRDTVGAIIRRLRSAISQMGSARIIKHDEYLVSFEVQVRGRRVQFDLLPTADNFGGGQSMSQIFRRMPRMTDTERASYSASLVEYQRTFIGGQPGSVKELIRLVKFWAYHKLPKELQKSFPLEVITIYRWEKAGSPGRFSKAQGLKDVLTTLTNLGTLRYYWTEYYTADLAENCISNLNIRCPVVLDPANPTNNACWLYWGKRKTEMESVARATLQCPLLRGVTVYSNWRD